MATKHHSLRKKILLTKGSIGELRKSIDESVRLVDVLLKERTRLNATIAHTRKQCRFAIKSLQSHQQRLENLQSEKSNTTSKTTDFKRVKIAVIEAIGMSSIDSDDLAGVIADVLGESPDSRRVTGYMGCLVRDKIVSKYSDGTFSL